MQTYPSPPKSYSLIKNLLPSISLIGETGQNQQKQKKFRVNPHIESQVETIIQTVQNLSFDTLKETLNDNLNKLQKLTQSSHFIDTEEQKLLSDDFIIERLRQLKLITEVMVERMNEKYKQAENSFRQLETTMKQNNKKLGVRSFFYWKRLENKQVKIKKIQESQSTQRKAEIFNDKIQTKLSQSDQKKTRKQQEKVRSTRSNSKKP